MIKKRVAILGSGNIGMDLLYKVMRSPILTCTALAGRNSQSNGLQLARSLGITTYDRGIESLIENQNSFDIAFDATSAADHLIHWPIFQRLGKKVVDMTPSRIGEMIIPAINIDQASKHQNVNMVSCGGQASLPLAYAIAKTQKNIEYIEVVSSIASKSAGLATRANIDEYIHTTEDALRTFTKCPVAKAILILNPAQPPINMQTTVSAKLKEPDLTSLQPVINDIVDSIKKYVPGYDMIVPPVYEQDRIVVMVKVTGLGDYLPTYAGNLDIINCAAIITAEKFEL
jgi:acetaldehyde dehydrogenase (acetylating)